MPVGADEAARAAVRAWEHLAAAIPGARTRREGGALGVITGVGLAGALAPEMRSLRALSPDEGALHAYVGEVAEEAVTTALGMRVDDNLGILNVATVPAHRRRGYGAAVTARAVSDGLEAGARWAWLMASPSGEPVYRSLGFATIEH